MKILLQAIKSLLRGIEARLTNKLTSLTNKLTSKIEDDLRGKLDTHNPTVTGSFSLGRNGDYAIGYNSFAAGADVEASGSCSHAEGYFSSARGENSHAEGYSSASGKNSHAEGGGSASGENSHAEGDGTIASGDYQHAQGKYNVEDTANKYAHIVGNGSGNFNRSNAHTLDWDGNAWFQGGIKVGGTGWDNATDEVALKSDLEGLGSGGGTNVLNPDGIIKQEHLPAGFPYECTNIQNLLTDVILSYDGDGVGDMPITDEFSLVVGNTYVVTWNGVEYTCVSQEVDVGFGAPITAIGNFDLATEAGDTGEPFLIASFPAEFVPELGFYGVATPLDNSTSATLSIKGVVTTTERIHHKYLPDGYPWEQQEVIYAESQDITMVDGVGAIVFTRPLEAGKEYALVISTELYELELKGTAKPINDPDAGEIGVGFNASGTLPESTEVMTAQVINVYPEFVDALGMSGAVVGEIPNGVYRFGVKIPHVVHPMDAKYAQFPPVTFDLIALGFPAIKFDGKGGSKTIHIPSSEQLKHAAETFEHVAETSGVARFILGDVDGDAIHLTGYSSYIRQALSGVYTSDSFTACLPLNDGICHVNISIQAMEIRVNLSYQFYRKLILPYQDVWFELRLNGNGEFSAERIEES